MLKASDSVMYRSKAVITKERVRMDMGGRNSGKRHGICVRNEISSQAASSAGVRAPTYNGSSSFQTRKVVFGNVSFQYTPAVNLTGVLLMKG